MAVQPVLFDEEAMAEITRPADENQNLAEVAVHKNDAPAQKCVRSVIGVHGTVRVE